ncbi:MAG: hypothetical protein IKS54_06465 [Erysipelotrichaceae bacterium]|nr:hypothetical protein [Erysipelotrichaceae bacterium]
MLSGAEAVSGTPYDSVIAETAKIDSLKTGMLLYDPFGTGYVTLGERVGTAWKEGRKYMEEGQRGDAL